MGRPAKRRPPDAPDPPPRRQRAPRRTGAELDAAIVPGSLAERVLGLMRQRGLTAKALSIRAGLSSDGVRSILRGRIDSPRAQSLVQLAAALGVSVDDLTASTLALPEAVRAAAGAAADILEADVPEFDLRTRSGAVLDTEILRGNRRRSWRLPLDLLEERGFPSSGLAVVRIAGGLAGYDPTDRILVDTSARRPSAGAVLVVHEGGERHVLARIATGYVHPRGAMTWTDDTGASRPHQEIVGTVLGKWTWV